MLRVTERQLEELRALYGDIQTKPAKHSVYIVCDRDHEADYRRVIRGDLSNRQKNKLQWYYRKRRRKRTMTNAL